MPANGNRNFPLPRLVTLKRNFFRTGDPFDEKRITVSQEIDFPLTTAYRLKGLSEQVKAVALPDKVERKRN